MAPLFGRLRVHVHATDGIFHKVTRAGVLSVIAGIKPAELIFMELTLLPAL